MTLNQCEVIFLEYPQNLVVYYQKLHRLSGFVLLESADQTLGQYDIISALPYDRIRVDVSTTITDDLIADIARKLQPRPSSFNLPFQGGALGYISYDFGAKYFDIHSLPQTDLKTVPLLDLGLYDWAIIVDHWNKTISLFAAHQHDNTRYVIDEVLALWHGDNDDITDYQLTSELISITPESQYKNSFNNIHSYLKKGRCYQVNLTQPFQMSYQGDSWEVYKNIRKTNQVPFSAYMSLDDGALLSFSPERFILYEDGVLSTSPIKGTIKRSDSLQEDEQLKLQLIHSEKNRAENIMIVDLMRNDLAQISESRSVVVEQLCELQSFKAVHHLVSHIKSKKRDDILPFEAFMTCFPGGSITGAPKYESMKIIAEEEHHARGIYCGSIGYFSNHGRFDTNIAIRTITATKNILHFAAGGGLVIDSECEDEYRECFTKIKAILNGIKK